MASSWRDPGQHFNISYLPSSHAMMGGCRACCEMAQLFHLAFISAVLSFCKIQIKIWLQDKRGQYSWSDKCVISSNLMHFCDFTIRGIMDYTQQLQISSWGLKFSSHLIEMYRLMFLPGLVEIAGWIKVEVVKLVTHAICMTLKLDQQG